MESKITRIIETAGPIQKMSLKSLARASYSLDLKTIALREGYIFDYGSYSTIIRKTVSEIEILVSIYDIWYATVEETKDIEEYRYLEYNMSNEKTRLVKDTPEIISERDECYYFDIIQAKIYYGELALGIIKKEEEKKCCHLKKKED